MMFCCKALIAQTSNSGVQSWLRTFSTESPFLNTQIYSISTDRRGLVYFAHSSGISEYDGVEWRIIPVPENRSILSLKRNPSGRIYAAGENILGYLYVDRNGNTRFEELFPPANVGSAETFFNIETNSDEVHFVGISSIYKYANGELSKIGEGTFVSSGQVGGKLFVSDQNRGLMFFQNDKLTPIDAFSYLRPTTMAALNDSTLLLGMRSKGIKKINLGAQSTSLSDWGINSKQFTDISSIDVYQDRLVAIGSFSAGMSLNSIDGKEIYHLSQKSGLPSNSVYDVFFTERATLWLGLNEGVALLDLPNIIDGLKKTVSSDEYNSSINDSKDALISETLERSWMDWISEFANTTYSWFSQKTLIKNDFIDDTEAVNSFASIVRKVEYIPNDSLIFGGAYAQSQLGVQSLKQSDSLTFSFEFDFNAFRFSYATNQFDGSGAISYRVKLVGLDRDWSTWNENTYREYTNLGWGNYTFLVEAQNADGKISTPATFSFNIIPPWYESSWFYLIQFGTLLMALIISGILNKAGKATSLSEALIAVVVIVIFQYVDFYIDPYLDNYSNGIAVFKILISIIFGFSLEFIEEIFHKIIAKITGLSDRNKELEPEIKLGN